MHPERKFIMTNQEIERKFLVTGTGYRAEATDHHHIAQGYLCKDKERTVRIRIRDEHGFITIKSACADLSAEHFAHYEWEREIDVCDARELLARCLPGIIEKTRYVIPAADGLCWEVDEFEGRLSGLVLAEIELPSESHPISRPAWLGDEVTTDPRYYNANL